jgi:hypothetical protein
VSDFKEVGRDVPCSKLKSLAILVLKAEDVELAVGDGEAVSTCLAALALACLAMVFCAL